MNRQTKRASTIVAAMMAAGLSMISGAARADDTFEAQDDGSGQRVIFKDDPLAALPNGVEGATIIVRPGAVRALLLRPRTQFVSEMLKSVENL